jgi:hypothetical protein
LGFPPFILNVPGGSEVFDYLFSGPVWTGHVSDGVGEGFVAKVRTFNPVRVVL